MSMRSVNLMVAFFRVLFYTLVIVSVVCFLLRLFGVFPEGNAAGVMIWTGALVLAILDTRRWYKRLRRSW